MKKASTRINLDQDLLDWIQQEAKRRHCSVSQVIRDLIVSEQQRREPAC